MRNLSAMSRRKAIVATLLTAVLVVSACSSGPGTESVVSTTVAPTTLDESRATQVLLAAVILATGDVEDALLQGLVTPADVQDAADAIADGTLDQWRAAAESAARE